MSPSWFTKSRIVIYLLLALNLLLIWGNIRQASVIAAQRTLLRSFIRREIEMDTFLVKVQAQMKEIVDSCVPKKD